MSASASAAHARSGPPPAPTAIPEQELRDLARLVAAVAAGDDGAARAAAASLRGRLDRRAAVEAVLQTHLFAGFPAAIEGLLALSAEWPPDETPSAPGVPADGREDVTRWRARGEELCERVYGSRYPRLREWMRRLSPELDEWMVVEGYGKTLGRAGLGAAERELCVVAALAARGAVRQLEPHLEGAGRLGVPRELVRAVARDALAHAPAERRARVAALVERGPREPSPAPPTFA